MVRGRLRDRVGASVQLKAQAHHGRVKRAAYLLLTTYYLLLTTYYLLLTTYYLLPWPREACGVVLVKALVHQPRAWLGVMVGVGVG